MRQLIQMKPTPKEFQEIQKNYEKVVEHLINEGYADDKDSADNIIKGMSESWYSLIISE
jgi:SOS response regulatory protein OraA/RecX